MLVRRAFFCVSNPAEQNRQFAPLQKVHIRKLWSICFLSMLYSSINSRSCTRKSQVFPSASIEKNLRLTKYTRFEYIYFLATACSLWLKSIPDFSILFSHGGVWLKSIPDLSFSILFSHGSLWLKSIPDFCILFSHGSLWLKSIPDFSILFNHGGLWLKSIPDFSILFSHGGLWLIRSIQVCHLKRAFRCVSAPQSRISNLQHSYAKSMHGLQAF
jgi:hypothetical protein